MKNIAKEILAEAKFGTLALSHDNKPYSLPINFVQLDGNIYFHGSKKGRKINAIQNNQLASFSVVESCSIIDSDFSTTDNLACPATHFFKSVLIDGRIEFVEEYDEKVLMLSSFMKKLQPKGGHKPLSDRVYKKAINATLIYKLVPDEISTKLKFGQKLTKERFDMIIKNLKTRDKPKDAETIKLMIEHFGKQK